MIIFINNLNPITYFFALILKPFFRVIYWRPENIPERWLKGFENIAADELMTLDDWYATAEEVHGYWKRAARVWDDNPPLRLPFGTVAIDFTDRWLQWLCMEYERQFLFRKLVALWLKKNQVSKQAYRAGTLLDFRQADFGLNFPEDNVRVLKFCAAFDKVWYIARAARSFLILITQAFKSGISCENGKSAYESFWLGISPSEIPSEPNKLDFSSVARQTGTLEKNLFFLPQNPSTEQREWLKKNRVAWTVAPEAFKLLALGDRASYLFESLKMTWAELWSGSKTRHEGAIVLWLAYQAVPWVGLCSSYRPKNLLLSVAGSWPEPPAVCACNAMGVRTVVWFYGSNIYRYNTNSAKLADLEVAHSVSVAKEKWLWSEDAQFEYERRHVRSKKYWPTVRLIGPVMCGDRTLMAQSPTDLRQQHGINSQPEDFFISVFDVPAITRMSRARWGFGPAPYPIDMLEAFFKDLTEVLRANPRARLILKPKRSFNDSSREHPTPLWRLIDPNGEFVKNKRVILLDHASDPYLAVAMADICVGLPFTSPVMVALHYRRPCVYHDPLGQFQKYRPRIFEKLFTRSESQLRDRLAALASGQFVIPYNEYEAVMGPQGDPMGHFKKALNGIPVHSSADLKTLRPAFDHAIDNSLE